VSVRRGRPHGSTLFAAPLGRAAILLAVAPTTRSETRRVATGPSLRLLAALARASAAAFFAARARAARARAPATRVGRSVDGGYAHTRIVLVGRSVDGSAHTKSLGSRLDKSAEGRHTHSYSYSSCSDKHASSERRRWGGESSCSASAARAQLALLDVVRVAEPRRRDQRLELARAERRDVDGRLLLDERDVARLVARDVSAPPVSPAAKRARGVRGPTR